MLQALLPMFVRRAAKSLKQRMRVERLGLELRMELHAQKPRMVGDFANLHVNLVRRGTRKTQAGRHHQFFILAIEFVTMTVTLGYLELAVGLMREAARLDLARPRAQAHRTAELV